MQRSPAQWHFDYAFVFHGLSMHFVLITHWDISIKSNYVHLSESIFREHFLRGAHISPTTRLDRIEITTVAMGVWDSSGFHDFIDNNLELGRLGGCNWRMQYHSEDLRTSASFYFINGLMMAMWVMRVQIVSTLLYGAREKKSNER